VHDFNRAPKSSLGNAEQPLRAIVDHADRNREGRVPYPSLLDYADIELHDVAILNTSLAADSVHNLVVERDTDVARKNAMPESVTEKCALHAGFRH